MKNARALTKRGSILAAGLVGAMGFLGISLSTTSFAFEAGQRWSCVTDQGEQAFLAVQNVEGEAISFSWGVMRSDGEFSTLCNKRDALSYEEMSEFCELVTSDLSSGHAQLATACNQ